MSDFNISVTNSQNQNVTKPHACADSNLSASNSATITVVEDLNCTGDATLVVTHSATINVAAIFHLPKLTCKTLTIKADHSSTVTIYELQCDNLVLDVGYASTVTIQQGSVGAASGDIKYGSTGVCHAKIKGNNNVKADADSTWVT